MHASSLENMRLCYERYIENSTIFNIKNITVLDIGGADVNGSYSDIFDDKKFNYIAADLSPADGVGVVLEDPYKLPFEDNSIDIVLSGQALEHCEFFWLSFSEMVRILKPHGFIFLIVPSSGPIHRYPVDCYRFYPDAYNALAKYTNCKLIDMWLDERGPWNDLVGVFRKKDAPKLTYSDNSINKKISILPNQTNSNKPEEEIRSGSELYLKTLDKIHSYLKPSFYLEIGVRLGNSLKIASCSAVGIDPNPDVNFELKSNTHIFNMTSDEFFRQTAKDALKQTPDLIFIDGMHLFEYVLRDFMNVERISAPWSLIIIDDIFPNHKKQASRIRQTQVWTGDVWKIYLCLQKYRPDLMLIPLNTSPTGLLLICGINPQNRILWEKYNPIVREYTGKEQGPPPEILTRSIITNNNINISNKICKILHEAKINNKSTKLFINEIREILEEKIVSSQAT